MKKTFSTLTILAALGVAGLQNAEARRGGGPCPGDCNGPRFNEQGKMDTEALEARKQFLLETAELRKQIATKRIDLRVEMSKDPIDEEKAKALQADLFDLKEGLHSKALDAGLQPGMMGGGRHHGMGGGMMKGNCPNIDPDMGE